MISSHLKFDSIEWAILDYIEYLDTLVGSPLAYRIRYVLSEGNNYEYEHSHTNTNPGEIGSDITG